jgi:hypothetical protein
LQAIQFKACTFSNLHENAIGQLDRCFVELQDQLLALQGEQLVRRSAPLDYRANREELNAWVLELGLPPEAFHTSTAEYLYDQLLRGNLRFPNLTSAQRYVLKRALLKGKAIAIQGWQQRAARE